MTGLLWLDWAMLAVSLFNTLLLLWLSLTVILNAERRVWGIWLASAGLLLGAIFFISHSAILGSGLSIVTPGLDFWWQLGVAPVMALPFMWYLIVLWYAGYWERAPGEAGTRGQLYRRQRGWFTLAVLCGLALIGLLGVANPLPSLSNLAYDRLPSTVASTQAASIAGLPALILAYPLYTLLCMALSIDALRHPEISGRLMGDLARLRARRWLSATALVLLGVSLLVGGVMIWIVEYARKDILNNQFIVTVGWFDLMIGGLIAVSVLLLGQAVVAYEVFTGKTLPRRGLAQYWRRAVILAAGFSALASAGLTLGLRPIYTILLSVIVMIIFLALLGWRAFAERQRLIENLRPFAASPRIIDSLLKEGASQGRETGGETGAPFQALCANVLETRQAGLFPFGPLALLEGPAIFYPPGTPFSPPDLDEIAARFEETKRNSGIGLSLDPIDTGGLVFAIPLWREAGLSGVFLLGQKHGDRPYTQEEIEIAQATGERLIDAQASAEMARRLVALQRRHMAAGRVADQRVRRMLHDEALPLVHTVMLELAGGEAAQRNYSKALDLLQELHQQLTHLLGSMPAAATPGVEADGLVEALRRTVCDELDGAFDEVEWQVDPQAEALARDLPPLSAEVLYSAAREGLRNAARHGRGDDSGYRLCLKVSVEADSEERLRVTLEDNGVGFIDQPVSESTEDTAHAGQGGSGQGLALHSTLMAVIGGAMTLSSQPGQRTCLALELPRTAWES